MLLWNTDFFKYKNIQNANKKVDAYTDDASMSLDNNFQEPGETNTNEVHNDQHGTKPA